MALNKMIDADKISTDQLFLCKSASAFASGNSLPKEANECRTKAGTNSDRYPTLMDGVIVSTQSYISHYIQSTLQNRDKNTANPCCQDTSPSSAPL